ncbi:little elongation complex subunit 1 isoform X2 [Nycticebus coucang]|uniref:little elongation complex subunit 1 isoform X2 n=1 Tax=Nycticebus coucang TaxID=9470 RepID=UPI00234C154D|nr:little elongation complex subunit 1 isoform X2 [Nycticebus coucang]
MPTGPGGSTMMPGETHSAAPGTAADLSRCQGCASLQQNLNEYVEALITLKQKIINTDNLLTEYQKKCDELQFARRENTTLHHQVEQMLQKISPLQKCQEELGSLKAELEEKKSSLKLYQDTHQEYARVKEECLKTDAQKKKLEAKVKKLEEAAVKQIQDFKQLRNEKKILEKEFKKTQERLDEFSKQKNEKELRHIGTQISSDSYGSIDKRKVKLLLKELWLCVNTTHRLPGEGSRCVPEKPATENTRSRVSRKDGTLPPAQGNPLSTSDVQTCLTKLSMEIEGDFSSCKSMDKERPSGAHHSLDRVFEEDGNPEGLMQSHNDGDSTDFSDHDHFLDDDLQAAIDFFKLPPPLLSPVPSPPLMASSHLASLPSSLAPETYFEEYTDSSDNDSAQLRSSTEYVSEDDTTESQNYFGSFRKNKESGTWENKSKSHGPTQSLHALEINKTTTLGLETLPATLREPLAHEKHRTVSSQFVSDRKGEMFQEAKTQTEIREKDKSVQTERTFPKRTRSLCVEQSPGSPTQGVDAAPGASALWLSPLGKRPLRECSESEEETLTSRAIGSPKSEFTKWTLTNEITSESVCSTGSDHFQRASREVETQTEGMQGVVLGESPESDDADATGGATDTEGLGADASVSSSPTSAALSVCSNPQSFSGLESVNDIDIPTNVFPAELHRSKQKLQTKTLSTLHLQSEPPECSVGRNSRAGSLPAVSPELRASHFNDQKSSDIECTKVVKGMTKINLLPQSVFMSAAGDRQRENQDPGAQLTLKKPDFLQAGLGFVRSASWHQSDLLRKGVREGLRAKSEQEQKAAPSLQDKGSGPELYLRRENSAAGFTMAASLLSNQVSVITKQARPEKIPGAELEHVSLQRNEPAPAAEHGSGAADHVPSAAECGGERDSAAQDSREAAAVRSTSPEVSASRGESDVSSPKGSLSVENSDCSTNTELSFSSENICVQNQDTLREAEEQREAVVQKERQLPQVTDPDSSGTGGSEPPASEGTVLGGFPVEEKPSEALAIANSPPSTQQNANELLELESQTPGGALPKYLVTIDTSLSSVFCRKVGEVQDTTPTSLAGTLCSYTGIREEREDTEVEESEGPSCSEGEQEPEAVVGGKQHSAPADPQGGAGDAGAGEAEARPSLEVGYLTSALQDFSISAFSELDRLSTSEVVMFLESCQLRDCSSGDSVSECSSKGTLSKEMNKESKQNEILGEKCGMQPCEEETLGTCEEWIESEDDDSLKNTSQLTPCSLETLSEVLTKIGQELQTHHEDCNGKDPGNVLLLNEHDSMTADGVKEEVPPPEAVGSLSHASEPPLLEADLDPRASPPVSGRPSDENTQGQPEDTADASGQADGGDKDQVEPAEGEALCVDAAVEAVIEQSASCEVETTFQCQISTVTSEVINVLINKDQNLVIEKGDNWTVISGVAVIPHVDQVTLYDPPEDLPVPQDQGGLEAGCVPVTCVEKPPEGSPAGPPVQEPPCSSNLSCPQEDVSSSGQSTNFDKSRLRNRPVKPSIWVSSQIYDQDFDSQTVPSDHTYYNSKLESSGKNKNRSKSSSKDQSHKAAKTLASSRIEAHQSEVSQSFSGEKGNTKTQRSQTQTILANADTSTDCSPDTLSKIRQEVGPPLPPLLAPLIATPPRTSQPLSPLPASSSPSSPASPVDPISPFCEIPVPPVMSPWPEKPRRTSPPGPSPSPSAAAAGERIVSSPLQFCAATPKHALPVPGRLPPCASGPAAVGGPQENSVKILDTMYPELSARARTLNILKGNIQFTRGPPTNSKNLSGPVSAMIGFKAITSTSTAFVKTGSGSGGDRNQDKARDVGTQQNSTGKRTLSVSAPRSAKRLRLDSGSPEPKTRGASAEGIRKNLQRNVPQAEETTEEERSCSSPTVGAVSQLPLNPKETVESHDKAIASALKKIAEFSFDLLPVIRSHVYVGNISKKPVMRDQEKEVVFEFSTTKKHLAECLLHSILSELKIQKMSTDHSYIHALCRVYVGICRQLGDLERARLFCYSLLKEDFPESEKLTLFIANMWHDVFLSQSVINKAMQLVARQRAKGEVLNCLRAFLNWEKNAPVDVGFMVSKLLLTIQLCPKTEFQSSEKFGEDLSDNTWEYIFAIDLLCCHQKWIWTHDNIISKELWPVMDKWIKYRKGHANIAYIPDIIIASILRLIGRLGQLGLKEGFPSAVKNISSVIGMFIQHAQDEDIPWGIQLAAVYALCDLSPSNPEEISKILEAWRREASKIIPSAILSYLEEVSALRAEELG